MCFHDEPVMNAVNSSPVIVPIGGVLPFASTRVKDFCCNCSGIRHETGSGRFVLLNEGDYQIIFTGSYTSNSSGSVLVNIEADGTAITGGGFEDTVVEHVVKSGVAQTIVKVYCKGTTSVSIVNNSEIPIKFTSSCISIVKVR